MLFKMTPFPSEQCFHFLSLSNANTFKLLMHFVLYCIFAKTYLFRFERKTKIKWNFATREEAILYLRWYITTNWTFWMLFFKWKAKQDIASLVINRRILIFQKNVIKHFILWLFETEKFLTLSLKSWFWER